MEFNALAKKLKALACEQRLSIIYLLKQWEGIDGCCEGAVRKAFTRASKELHIGKSTLSHHFKELENAGLISCTRNGQAIACKVNEAAFKELREFIGDDQQGCCCSGKPEKAEKPL